MKVRWNKQWGLVDSSPNAEHRYKGLYCESGFPLDVCEEEDSLDKWSRLKMSPVLAQSARLHSLTEFVPQLLVDQDSAMAFGRGQQDEPLARLSGVLPPLPSSAHGLSTAVLAGARLPHPPDATPSGGILPKIVMHADQIPLSPRLICNGRQYTDAIMMGTHAHDSNSNCVEGRSGRAFPHLPLVRNPGRSGRAFPRPSCTLTDHYKLQRPQN